MIESTEVRILAPAQGEKGQVLIWKDKWRITNIQLLLSIWYFITSEKNSKQQERFGEMKTYLSRRVS